MAYNELNRRDDTYFNVDYTGRYFQEKAILPTFDSDISVRFFQCKKCAALTMEPAIHETWHKELG